jgi:ferrous iron transport protein A
MTTLREVKPGNAVRVVRLNGSGALRRRILDMGITKGARIAVRKIAPLGDPIEVTVRGYELSLRKSEAVLIEVSEDAQ